jgi:hypothetical protein
MTFGPASSPVNRDPVSLITVPVCSLPSAPPPANPHDSSAPNQCMYAIRSHAIQEGLCDHVRGCSSPH